MMTWRVALLLVVIALAVAVTLPSIRAYVNQQETLSELRAEAQAGREEVDDLTAEVARWEDPAYLVAQARERLTYVFPGETPYRVVDADMVAGPAEGSPAAEREPAALAGAPWYDRLWGSVLEAGEGSGATEPAPAAADAIDTPDSPATDDPTGDTDTDNPSAPSGDVESGE